MAQAHVSQIFNAPIKKAFEVVASYGNYPKFLSDVKRTSVLESSPNKKLVEFEIQVIKSFRYQLWLSETPSEEITWKLHSGDIFKENSGSWRFRSLDDGRTHAEYTINAKLGIFVPGMIEKKLIEVNLPNMMEAFKKEIEEK